MLTSGDAIDDEILADVARRSDIQAPRDWGHYLYFPDEATARRAAVDVVQAGWSIATLEPSDGPPRQWLLVAERHAVTTHAAVREARLFFTALAEHVGGDYDGWDVTV